MLPASELFLYRLVLHDLISFNGNDRKGLIFRQPKHHLSFRIILFLTVQAMNSLELYGKTFHLVSNTQFLAQLELEQELERGRVRGRVREKSPQVVRALQVQEKLLRAARTL